MKSCCENKEVELKALRKTQAHILKIVLTINATMFFVEGTSGIIARSTSLMADSLDMFGDAVVYAFSLYVLDKEPHWRAKAAFLKGIIMLLFGAGVLFEAVSKIFSHVVPTAETMGVVGLLVLIANTACLLLLLKHRNDDINMRSTWLCSRNDIVANLGVLIASGLVAITNSKWPDITVGLIIASLFLHSSWGTLKESVKALKESSSGHLSENLPS